MNGYGFMDLLQSIVIKRFDVSNRILDQSTDAHTHTKQSFGIKLMTEKKNITRNE